MSGSKKLEGMMKQNDGIYSSLSSRGIEFTRHQIDMSNLDTKSSDEINQLMELIMKENAELKDLANKNKPPPQPKEVKQTPAPKPKETKSEAKTESTNNADADEPSYEEPVKKFTTIFNMEDAKRAFFGKEYDQFNEIIRTQLSTQPQLKFYTVTYKYASDKDGAPSFSAKNLIGGFVRSFDDYRKYFMIGFRCIKHETETTYTYPSYWIVNSTDSVQDIIGSLYDDYTFEEVDTTNEVCVTNFLKQLEKIRDTDADNDLLIEEKYVH